MTHIKTVLCLALGIAAFGLVTVDAACRKCSSISSAACLNETGFAVCLNGQMTSMQGVCPNGQVCTEQQGVCKPRSSTRPVCGTCDICYMRFSCKSRTQFEYCADLVHTGIVMKCPEGEYCSLSNFIQNRNICVKSCLGEPTCFADEVVVTPAPDPTYADICTASIAKGTYENIYDSTCKTYVYCEELNQKMTAILYTCDSGYFNDVLKKCTSAKPARCT